MNSSSYSDYDYLLRNAKSIFPGASIEVIHTDEEVIHIDVDGHRYTFEVTSNDDSYIFTDGHETFEIPLMGEDF